MQTHAIEGSVCTDGLASLQEQIKHCPGLTLEHNLDNVGKREESKRDGAMQP